MTKTRLALIGLMSAAYGCMCAEFGHKQAVALIDKCMTSLKSFDPDHASSKTTH